MLDGAAGAMLDIVDVRDFGNKSTASVGDGCMSCLAWAFVALQQWGLDAGVDHDGASWKEFLVHYRGPNGSNTAAGLVFM